MPLTRWYASVNSVKLAKYAMSMLNYVEFVNVRNSATEKLWRFITLVEGESYSRAKILTLFINKATSDFFDVFI